MLPLGAEQWTVQEAGGEATVRPSIGSWQLPCRSHYWITAGAVVWSGQWTPEQIERGRQDEERRLRAHFEGRKARKQGWLPAIWGEQRHFLGHEGRVVRTASIHADPPLSARHPRGQLRHPDHRRHPGGLAPRTRGLRRRGGGGKRPSCPMPLPGGGGQPDPLAVQPAPKRRQERRPLRRVRRRKSRPRFKKFVLLVKTHKAGMRAEDIRAAPGMQAKEMPRILKEGVAKKKLASKGQKRSTTYFMKCRRRRRRSVPDMLPADWTGRYAIRDAYRDAYRFGVTGWTLQYAVVPIPSRNVTLRNLAETALNRLDTVGVVDSGPLAQRRLGRSWSAATWPTEAERKRGRINRRPSVTPGVGEPGKRCPPPDNHRTGVEAPG